MLPVGNLGGRGRGGRRSVQEWPVDKNGVLALVGGNEWTPGCSFDAKLLAASGGKDVLVLPTAAAYQHPERVVLQAAEWFAALGGQVEGLMVVDRASAGDPGMAAVGSTSTSFPPDAASSFASKEHPGVHSFPPTRASTPFLSTGHSCTLRTRPRPRPPRLPTGSIRPHVH